LVYRELQLRFLILTVLATFIFGAAVGWLVYYITWSASLESKGIWLNQISLDEIFHRVTTAIFFTLLGALVVGAGIGGILSLLITHKVAGPLYRIRKIVEEVSEGKEVEKIRIRKGDELQDFVEDFNRVLSLIQDLRERKEKARKELISSLSGKKIDRESIEKALKILEGGEE